MARVNVRRTRAVVLDVRPGRPHRTGAGIETAGAMTVTAMGTGIETAIARGEATAIVTATRTEDETTTTTHLVGTVTTSGIATGGKTVNVRARGTGMSRPGGGTRTATSCMFALCVILD